MKVVKQFKDIAVGVCTLVSDEDAFVPEMSLPIKDILAQFAYVDNIRLGDIAKQGFEYADQNENDFDVEEFDRLDLAEKQEIYEHAKSIIDRYEETQRAQAIKQEPQTPDEET